MLSSIKFFQMFGRTMLLIGMLLSFMWGSLSAAMARLSAPPLAPQVNNVYEEDFSDYVYKQSTDETEWEPWLPGLRLTRYDVIYKTNAAAVLDSSGQLLTVWEDYRNSNSDIYAQKLDTNGNILWASDKRVDSGSSVASTPAIAMNQNGQAFVAWIDGRNTGSCVDYLGCDVYIQKLDADGNRLWANDIRVNVNNMGNANTEAGPAIGIDGNGQVFVSWVTYDKGVFVQKLDTNGNHLWGNDVQISLAKRKERPAIAVSASGQVLVVWVDGRNGNEDIYAQKLDGNGVRLWANDVRVNGDSGTDPQKSPAVAINGSGQYFVVWSNGDRVFYGDIYAQKLDGNGSRLWTADQQVNLPNKVDIKDDPTIAVDSNGQAVIAWKEYSIHVQKLDGNGNKLWDAPARLQDDTIYPGTPAITINNAGQALVVVEGTRSRDEDIYVQKVGANGEMQWENGKRVSDDSGMVVQSGQDIAVLGNGQSIVVWADTRNGEFDYYAQKLGMDGSRLWQNDIRIISENKPNDISFPVMAGDGGTQVVVVWSDKRKGNWDVFAQKLDSNGNRLWPGDVQVNGNSGISGQNAEDVVIDTNGNIYITWMEDADHQIYVQKLNKDGVRQWSADKIVGVGGLAARKYSSVITVNASSQVFIAWADERNGTDENPGLGKDIYAQKLDANGNQLWASDVCVNNQTGTNARRSPAISVDNLGRPVIAWGDEFLGYNDIHAQKLDTNGNRLWANDVRVNRAANSVTASLDPILKTNGSGQSFIAWSDHRNGGSAYAQKLDSNGNALWAEDQLINSVPLNNLAFTSNGQILIFWGDHRNGNDDSFVQKIEENGTRLWPNDVQVVVPDMFYHAAGTATSGTVDTINEPIQKAILNAEYQPNGGSVQFYLSNDGGTSWSEVIPGVLHIFNTSGSDLRWKVDLTVDPNWPRRSPIVSSLRIEYSSLVSDADAYESDDTCGAASPVAINGAQQQHSFHQANDADWAWFDATMGTTYIIQTANAQANANIKTAQYAQCEQAPIQQDDNAFGPDTHIIWTATYTGRVYVEVRNHDGNVFGSNTGYDLSVRSVAPAPVVVIVEGHDDAFSVQSNFRHIADQAYLTFANAGVPKLNIRYFSPETNRDVDSNGLMDDVYATPSGSAVRDAIQGWARERGVALGVPFYLVLIDHGGVDQYLAGGTQDKINPTSLGLWLSNLEATTGTDHINVIIEACKSGSFINLTEEGPATISGHNRVVITSTSSNLNAFPSSQGGYFSDAFWTMVGQNKDLKTSFEYAKQAVGNIGLSQMPWLDDNGDKQANAQDGDLARQRGLGNSFGGVPPAIDWLKLGKVVSGQLTVQAQVRDDFGVRKVRVVVVPPNFVEPAPAPDGTTPVLNLPEMVLTPGSDNLYTANLTGINQSGTYRLLVYAEDTDGNQALPKTVLLPNGTNIYLPVIKK